MKKNMSILLIFLLVSILPAKASSPQTDLITEKSVSTIQLSIMEQHLLPFMQRASLKEEVPLSFSEINSDACEYGANNAIIYDNSNFQFYIEALNSAIMNDDWVVVARLNRKKENESRARERSLSSFSPTADIYYFSNIVGLTLCSKYNRIKSAQFICNHLKSFYKGINADIGETHFMRSFFSGANHPLYVAQSRNNIAIIKIILKELTSKEDVRGSGLIFPGFYEEIFWHAMISKSVDFVKSLKSSSGDYYQKCNAEMQNNIDFFLKENDIEEFAQIDVVEEF